MINFDYQTGASVESFVVHSPEGMACWPPVVMDEANELVAHRSSYEGEPGWMIVPVDRALDRYGYLIDGRTVPKRSTPE